MGQPRSQIELPFKPFTFDEVSAVVGAESRVIDSLTLNVLTPKLGDDKLTIGLDWMQLFGVFVGARYLHEGAPPKRAQAVCRMLGNTSLEVLEGEIKVGRTFPAPKRVTGLKYDTFVKPPSGPLSKRVDVRLLLAEFRDKLNRVFPSVITS